MRFYERSPDSLPLGVGRRSVLRGRGGSWLPGIFLPGIQHIDPFRRHLVSDGVFGLTIPVGNFGVQVTNSYAEHSADMQRNLRKFAHNFLEFLFLQR